MSLWSRLFGKAASQRVWIGASVTVHNVRLGHMKMHGDANGEIARISSDSAIEVTMFCPCGCGQKGTTVIHAGSPDLVVWDEERSVAADPVPEFHHDLYAAAITLHKAIGGTAADTIEVLDSISSTYDAHDEHPSGPDLPVKEETHP